MTNISKVKEGDIFSEQSHFKVKKVLPNQVVFDHLEGKKEVSLSNDYVTSFLESADQYRAEATIGKEDKRDGTPGIRTIFERITTSHVFTVEFQKKDTTKSTKQYDEEVKAQHEKAIALIEKAKLQKKSMRQAYIDALDYVRNNPISTFIPGEMRVLRGYKIDFKTNDGMYSCFDMDINDIRQVNVNSIKSLIYKGIKYNVK